MSGAGEAQPSEARGVRRRAIDEQTTLHGAAAQP